MKPTNSTNSKRTYKIVDRNAADTSTEFWRTKTPEERISTVEFLREQFYLIQGYNKVPRIIKTIKITDDMIR